MFSRSVRTNDTNQLANCNAMQCTTRLNGCEIYGLELVEKEKEKEKTS
jgi:hypothetical protein